MKAARHERAQPCAHWPVQGRWAGDHGRPGLQHRNVALHGATLACIDMIQQGAKASASTEGPREALHGNEEPGDSQAWDLLRSLWLMRAVLL